MKEQQRSKTEALVEGDEPQWVVDQNATCVAINSAAADLVEFSQDELRGMDICRLVDMPDVEIGKTLRGCLEGATTSKEITYHDGAGGRIVVDVTPEKVVVDGEPYIHCTGELVERLEGGAGGEDEVFADIPNDKIARTAQNLRIEYPDGSVPLSALMIDLAASQNRVEKIKQGAYMLHTELEERLEEEEKHNPDSVECDVLRRAKESAFGLYLRIHRGDQELHGMRPGKWSGYFADD